MSTKVFVPDYSELSDDSLMSPAQKSYAVRTIGVQQTAALLIEALQDAEMDGLYYGEGGEADDRINRYVVQLQTGLAMLAHRGRQASQDH